MATDIAVGEEFGQSEEQELARNRCRKSIENLIQETK
jgi:hypothetical protein